MRRESLIFLLVSTAASLLSCATSSDRGALTVELFDSTAKDGSASGGTNAVSPIAAPIVPDLVGAMPDMRPGHEVSIPNASAAVSPASPRRTAFLSLPVAPAAVATASVDAGLAMAGNPRQTRAFFLATPEAPAAPPDRAAENRGTVGRTPPASAPQVSRSTVTGAAADLAPKPVDSAASGTGSSSGAAASNAAGSAPSAPTASIASSQVIGTAGLSDSYGRLREIYAREGDELQIGLDRTGFLFLGFPDKSSQADGMSFKAKENRNNKTWFTFQALKLGTYDLDFLLQENTTGKSAKETVRVHVVSDQEFNTAISQQSGQDAMGSGPAETGDPAFADRLSSRGAYDAAIVELQKGYKDGNPGLNDQIASLYMLTGAYDAAGKYYAKNLSPQNPFTGSAVIGMMRIAIAQKDQQGLLELLKRFLAAQDPGVEETLIKAARMERDMSQIGVGLDLAAEYATRYPGGRWRDEADFLQAQLLEADSQFRDIARARDLYREIVSSYPESSYAGPARERLLYIERHFFQVR